MLLGAIYLLAFQLAWAAKSDCPSALDESRRAVFETLIQDKFEFPHAKTAVRLRLIARALRDPWLSGATRFVMTPEVSRQLVSKVNHAHRIFGGKMLKNAGQVWDPVRWQLSEDIDAMDLVRGDEDWRDLGRRLDAYFESREYRELAQRLRTDIRAMLDRRGRRPRYFGRAVEVGAQKIARRYTRALGREVLATLNQTPRLRPTMIAFVAEMLPEVHSLTGGSADEDDHGLFTDGLVGRRAGARMR